MGPLDIASMLKQLNEVSRQRDVENKKRNREKISSSQQLEAKDAIDDIQRVNFEKNTIKPEDHQPNPYVPIKENNDASEPENESSTPLSKRIKEEYKANFLDLSE